MTSNIFLWNLNENVDIKTEINESVVKISNIENHLYILTINNNLYHGVVQTNNNSSFVELQHCDYFKLVDIDCHKDQIFIVTADGSVYRCNQNLEILNEIVLAEDYLCSRGHIGTKCRMKVIKIAVSEYGHLFITEFGHLWACGYMPQIGINSEYPKRVNFFIGRIIRSINIGHDFAIALVSKQKNDDTDSDEEDVFVSNCPQCRSASQLTSPASQTSLSEVSPLGIKILGSYDIETTSTSSKNDSSMSSNECRINCNDDSEKADNTPSEKNIIFRNTEAAREFLTKQISRMSIVGEEYLVECTEKPTRFVKENMTNVASFVYEGVKTVGDRVVTLSRHVSGSSDCNSIIENNDIQIHRTASKDEFMWSLSQCTSEKDLSEQDFKDNVQIILRKGLHLLNCEVWTWGNIIHGQLGIGDNMRRERPMIITKLSNIGVQKISVQNFHASVVTLDGRAYIWGRNDFNQVTVDSNFDHSSPKLYNNGKGERIRDVVCGKHFTILFDNKQDIIYYGKNSPKQLYLSSDIVHSNHILEIPLFENLSSSMQFTVTNINKAKDSFFSKFLTDEQKLLEEMLTVHINIIKPLQKKNSILFESLCKNYVNIMYLIAVNIHSLLEFDNNLISFCDIVILKHIEEYIFIFKHYVDIVNNVISIDGFHNISKLIDISQSLYKLRPEGFTKKEKNNDELLISLLLLEPIKVLPKYVALIQTTNINNDQKVVNTVKKLTQFIEEQETNTEAAEKTKQFWLNSGKSVDFLKNSNRRLIRDSHKYPINLQNAGRFSSHWFILFTDIFVHMVGSNTNVHNLNTVWLETQQDETSQQYQITLKMPEETITLYTIEPESKIDWLHTIQAAIKNVMNKPNALQPPSVRTGSFTFTRNGFLKDATYNGRWLNAKMHGKGKLEWPDGKLYTGQFNNNQLCGYGSMYIPNIGTYEGLWKDNQQNGFGTLTYVSTDIYRGHFKEGVPHGHGFLRKGNFMANTASFYIGDWVSGSKNGYGVLDDIFTGEKYIGNWSDNKKHGNGLIITSEGIYYEGIFSQDMLIGHGLMILEDGTHYEGEFKGTGLLNGKGVLSLPTGHSIEGTLSGSFDEGIKISNGIFLKSAEKRLPKSYEMLCAPVEQKWKALFRYFHLDLGIAEIGAGKNGLRVESDTGKIWQNVAISLSNASTLTRNKAERNKYQNPLHNLDIIPPFGRETLNLSTYLEVKDYLAKAFESAYHPLGNLLTNISEAYTTTYGGRAHPLLLTHAISELHHITKRLYEIVRYLFPALPVYEKDFLIAHDEGEEIVNYQSLLYPLILPKVHHPLFSLFTMKNEQQEGQYKRTLMEWNKQSDFTLMAFLSVDQKFYKSAEHFPRSPLKNHIFLDAIESLQQLKSTFSPIEKLEVIRSTVKKMTPVAQHLLGAKYVWNMDDLFPIFLYVVVRARIPDLGSELDFIDNFMDPGLESGELGIMFTTLKACYQQILQEKSSTY